MLRRLPLLPVAFLATASLCAGIATAQSPGARSGGYPQSYYRAPEPSVLRSFKMQQKLNDEQPNMQLPAAGFSACLGNEAGGYACANVDLLAFLPLADIGGGSGNDIWGWTDPQTGREYALVGRTNGTAFVDISDPINPQYLGDLPTHTSTSTWRDIKVYADHAFIGSEAGGHGMQVFDLTQLRSVVAPPVTFSSTAHYDDFGRSHNIVMNEGSGFAFGVGTNTCAGGLHMVDVRNPRAPTYAGCFDTDGYTHDAQCVIYHGPDGAYQGREICIAYNEDTVTVVDVTDKAAPVEVSRTGYADRGYSHQGWLTEDHRYILMDDELDERNGVGNTRTLIWDMSDLRSPVHIGDFVSSAPAIDHNLYTKDRFAFQSNYRAGLRILDLSCLDGGVGNVTEVGYFDIYPGDDDPSFNGTWSNYPYFASGVVIVNGIEQGLYVLRPNLPARTPPAFFEVCEGESLTLDAGSGFISYQWSSGESSQLIDITPAATTVYHFEARDSGGCLTTGEITVSVLPQPEPTIVPDSPRICQGESVILDAGAGYASYLWTSGAASQTVEVTPAMTESYGVEVATAGGCVETTERTVVVDQVHVNAGPDVEICAGDSIPLGSVRVGRQTYAWSPAPSLDDPTSATPLATPSATTIYTLGATDQQSGCQAFDEVAVSVIPRRSRVMGNVLLAVRSGDDVRHVWKAEASVTGYRLRRRGAKSDPAVVQVYNGDAASVVWLERDAVRSPGMHFDLVSAEVCATTDR